jgi:hypothetical protein
VQDFSGKPLVVIYMGTPSPFQAGAPAWNDLRFTVRWMTGFQDDQPNLIDGDRKSRYGFWSWWDRSPQTWAEHDGRPEAMVVCAAFPGHKGWDSTDTMGRRGGRTFHEQWLRARELDPEVVVINSWNEWVHTEEMTPELSNDLEPSAAWGHTYLDLLKEEIARYKAGRMLTPADAPAALRCAAGLSQPSPEDFARLNVDRTGASASRIDTRDALRIALALWD